MITEKEFEKAAQNALLIFSDSEKEKYIKEMSDVIDFVSIVTSYESSALDIYSPLVISAYDLRQDVVEDSLPTEVALSNIGGGEDGFFVAKRRSKGE